MKTIILAAALISAPFAGANAMTIATFLGKLDGLQKKGARALFSPDIGLLKNAGKAAATALRQERDLAVEAGRKPDFCTPAKSSMNSGDTLGAAEFMTHLRAIPLAQRGMSLKDAMSGLMKKKYPCPA